MTHSTDAFFDVPRTTRTTSEGVVDLPMLFDDTTMVLALFLADRELLAREVADQGLRPALTVGGRAAVVLAGFDYRGISIGPYGEVGLAVPVVPTDAPRRPRWHQMLRDVDASTRDLGFHILHLPVTTEAANAAGREIWGLPKFVTPIEVRARGREVLVRVEDPASGATPLLTMSGRLGPGVPSPPISLVLYSSLVGEELRTTVNARGRGTARWPGSTRLRVGAGDHPLVQTLRRLRLDGARPVAVATTDRFRSRLNEGVPTGRSTSSGVTPATP